MAPRKKRVVKSAVFSVRTRSGLKFQTSKKAPKKSVVKNSQDGKKIKEQVPLVKTIEPMLTRSHKKFGKYRFFTENEGVESHTKTSKDDSTASVNIKSVQNEIHSIEEVLLPDSEVSMENEGDSNEEIVITDESDNEHSTVQSDGSTVDVLSEENISQQSEENILLQQESVSPPSENCNEESNIQMECVVIQNQEALITQQLSNLEVNEQFLLESNNTTADVDNNCIVENVHYNTETEKDQDVYHIENFESEIIIDCISEDVIPICSEQEIINENDNSSDINDLGKEVIDDKIKIEPKAVFTSEKAVDITPDDSSVEDLQDKTLDLNIKDSDDTNVDVQKEISNTNVLKTITEETDESITKIEHKDECTEISNQDSLEIGVEYLSKPNEYVQDVKKDQLKSKVKGKLPKKKTVKAEKEDGSASKLSESSVRRSNRIKSISVLKQKSSKGHGLVKQKNEQVSKNIESDSGEINIQHTTESQSRNGQKSGSYAVESGTTHGEQKPVKVKSRWRRSSELELSSTMPINSSNKVVLHVTDTPQSNTTDVGTEDIAVKKYTKKEEKEEVAKRLKQFVHLKENLYLTERISCKEAKKMVCDCFLTEEDIQQGEYGCGEDCLNRLLMIECGNLCAVSDRCTNKRFQKGQFAPCEVFRTEKKGLGIRAAANIPYGEFILEYVGEVLDPEEFEKRAAEYSKDKNQHYYFMSLRADAVIDATRKGNVSRFINHSCDPNAETQKWTVNGELRIGFFSKRTILAGEEITFDYQFQRYGKEAQKCFCEAATCRGWLGEEPGDDEDDDEDDEEEEEDEEEDEVEDAEVEKNDAQVEKKDTEVITLSEKVESQGKPDESQKPIVVKTEKIIKKEKKKILRQRLPRKDMFEDLDLDDEIETLQTTGLKNQAHTLKLSRLMVRAKEPAQRTKLLRVLRRGELPCRRLFLDYHGLRLIHGWMTDAQHMSRINKKLESLRLEILQTLATLPIPNKTMLQDSKVLPTVEKWSVKLEEVSPIDSDSNSPKIESESVPHTTSGGVTLKEIGGDRSGTELSSEPGKTVQINKNFALRTGFAGRMTDRFQEDMDISPMPFDEKESAMEAKNVPLRNPTSSSTLCADDYETEIIALALKLLEEWSVLKEVFRIPKKERIEQMKEHEREADRKYKAGLGLDSQDIVLEKKDFYRYPWTRRQKKKKRKSSRMDRDAYFDKYERRKLFALQVEQREMERRRSQREFWRQHEQRCVVMGADPRFTAPFEPNQEYQCIWNPQTGQWQNYPLPRNQNFNTNMPPHHHVQHHLHHHPPQQPQQQHLPPVQPNQQQMLIPQHGHMIPNQPPAMPVNHPSPSMLPPMQQNQPMMKHMQPVNLPPSHGIHQKPPLTFNPQPPPPPHPSNTSQHQFNPRPLPVMNPPPNMNHMANVNVPNAPSSTYVQQQRGSNQCVPYPPVMPEHIQQQQQPQIVNYHLPPDNQNSTSTQMGLHVNAPPLQSNIHNKPPPPLPALPYQESIKEQEDVLQVKFMGPIPPPAKLPPKWKCAKDKYGRPYYYHIRIRKSQWEPPEFPPEENEELSESTSSSDTSSLSSDSSSEETDSDDDIDDAKLLLQLKNKFKQIDAVKTEKLDTEISSVGVTAEGDNDAEDLKEKSLDDRLIEEFCFMKGDTSLQAKRKRAGLVQEILISPRTEEDKLQFKEDMKRYKQNKEKLKRQKELLLEQSKKHTTIKASKPTTSVKAAKTSKKHKISVKTKLKEMTDSESARKIKETFRSSMAVVMVSILNTYRKPECKEGRITNTDDFKHLARKLTHFVMLKELKHCQNIEDLTCTDSVKSKAREFVRKYMSKFGETYQKPKDEAEFY